MPAEYHVSLENMVTLRNFGLVKTSFDYRPSVRTLNFSCKPIRGMSHYWNSRFLAGSCMAKVVHLTLRFSKTSKTLKTNRKKRDKHFFFYMKYNEENEEKGTGGGRQLLKR